MARLRIQTIERSIYGIIIYLALLLSLQEKAKSPWQVIFLLLGSLLVIALAESYASIISHKFHGTYPSKQQIFSELKSALLVLVGSELPILFLFFSALGYLELSLAINLSILSAIMLLFFYSYFGSRSLRRTRIKSFKIAVLSILFALLLVVLKLLLK